MLEILSIGCTNNSSRDLNLIIAMISSIILFTIISFILGWIFGQLWHRHKQSSKRSDIDNAHLHSSQVKHTSSATGHSIISAEQDLEMMENAAYGPLKLTTK